MQKITSGCQKRSAIWILWSKKSITETNPRWIRVSFKKRYKKPKRWLERAMNPPLKVLKTTTYFWLSAKKEPSEMSMKLGGLLCARDLPAYLPGKPARGSGCEKAVSDRDKSAGYLLVWPLLSRQTDQWYQVSIYECISLTQSFFLRESTKTLAETQKLWIWRKNTPKHYVGKMAIPVFY